MGTTITDRLSGITSDVAIKAPCIVATSSNITLNGLQTIDSVAVTQGQRVLVKGQTDATTNGVYLADTGNWKRAKDFDGQYDVMSGSMVFITSGALRQGTLWTIATADPITIGTTALAFTQVNLVSGGGGGASNPFTDAMALIKNTIDATKQVILSAAGITTGTTRTQTLQDVSDTFVYRATTDTLTNKTFDTAGAGNSFKINGQAISAVSGNTTKAATVSGALTSGHLVKSDASGNLVDAGALATTTLGTPIVVSPYSVGTVTSGAHGLGAKPRSQLLELECLSAEGGYLVGDTVNIGGSSLGIAATDTVLTVVHNATTSYLITNATQQVQISRKDTAANFNITAASWKITLTPVLIA